MKFLSFILSLYILILGMVPCADAAVDMHSGQATEMSITSSAPGDHHAEDICSPFCVCSCCHINVDQPALPETIASLTRQTGALPAIISPYTEPYAAIWKPPQL